jgi:mRNA (guanine-N7-)-methyltransferase
MSGPYDDRSLPVQIAAAQYAANVAEAHYNLHAAGSGKGPKVEKQVTKQLSEFHNKIKRNLIEFNTRAGKAVNHLDIACGRGGDIDKWAQAGLRFVFGVDVSPNEIKYARMRYSNYNQKSGTYLDCTFEATRDIGMRAIEWGVEFPHIGRQFDTVSCMFAAHYFFVSEYALDCFLHNVATALKPGGVFYGAIPLAPRIIEFLGGRGRNNNDVLEIRNYWADKPTEKTPAIGAKYTFNLKESVTGAAQEESQSMEYLVDPDVFTKVAARHGLLPMKATDPLNYFNTSEAKQKEFIEANYEEIPGHPEFRYFRPTYEGESARDLETVSRLNASFVFIRSSLGVASPAF